MYCIWMKLHFCFVCVCLWMRGSNPQTHPCPTSLVSRPARTLPSRGPSRADESHRAPDQRASDRSVKALWKDIRSYTSWHAYTCSGTDTHVQVSEACMHTHQQTNKHTYTCTNWQRSTKLQTNSGFKPQIQAMISPAHQTAQRAFSSNHTNTNAHTHTHTLRSLKTEGGWGTEKERERTEDIMWHISAEKLQSKKKKRKVLSSIVFSILLYILLRNLQKLKCAGHL